MVAVALVENLGRFVLVWSDEDEFRQVSLSFTSASVTMRRDSYRDAVLVPAA